MLKELLKTKNINFEYVNKDILISYFHVPYEKYIFIDSYEIKENIKIETYIIKRFEKNIENSLLILSNIENEIFYIEVNNQKNIIFVKRKTGDLEILNDEELSKNINLNILYSIYKKAKEIYRFCEKSEKNIYYKNEKNLFETFFKTILDNSFIILTKCIKYGVGTVGFEYEICDVNRKITIKEDGEIKQEIVLKELYTLEMMSEDIDSICVFNQIYTDHFNKKKMCENYIYKKRRRFVQLSLEEEDIKRGFVTVEITETDLENKNMLLYSLRSKKDLPKEFLPKYKLFRNKVISKEYNIIKMLIENKI